MVKLSERVITTKPYSDIRNRIETLREQENGLETPIQAKREMTGQSKDVLIASLRKKRPELGERYVLIFLIGINTGLRVNDHVRSKVSDVQSTLVFTIREGKTNKKREINVGILHRKIDRYIKKQTIEGLSVSESKGTSAHQSDTSLSDIGWCS